MKRLALAAVAALIGMAAFVLTTTSVHAADLLIPIDTFVDAPTGSTVTLGTFSSAAVDGQTCTVTSMGVNQESVHDNNNLIASSGGGSVTMLDVEGTPSKVSQAAGTLTMGATVTLSVFIGNQDSGLDGGVWSGIFSGGMNVEFECGPVVDTTTPPPPPPICHDNGDGIFTLLDSLTPEEALIHAGHTTDVAPNSEGGCQSPGTTSEPTLTVGGVSTVCDAGIPYIDYEIVTELAATSAVLWIEDLNGVEVYRDENADLKGRVIYPGASADPEDWPGWQLAPDGSWQQDPSDAHLRAGLQVWATINPTGSAPVSYPPESDACMDPATSRTSDDPPAGGGGASSGTPTGGLPVTGSGNTVGLLLAALALIAGGFLLIRSTRTDDTATDTPTD
jgi:LPXTG-motif cell wall-anchored protein